MVNALESFGLASSTRKYKSPSARSRDETEARYMGLIRPKSIACIRKGFEYFNGSHAFPSEDSKTFFYERRKLAQQIISVYKLSLDSPLPDLPIENNRHWKTCVLPHIPVIKDAMKYCKNLVETSVSPESSFNSPEEWIQQLKINVLSAKKVALKRNREARASLRKLRAKELGCNESADPEVTQRLVSIARSTIDRSLAETSAFLYFKAWEMKNGYKWYKIGVTTDIQRRDAEQNVLPVAPATLFKVQFRHIQHAKAVEQAFHLELMSMRIKGAKNKELFSLTPRQVGAVIEAMKAITRMT